MKRERVLKILSENRQALRDRSVKSLAIFGSVARDEATDASDVDLLVEFDPGHPKGLFEFIGVMNFLEDLLGCKVDLVMTDGIRKELREQVLREAIHAA
jgi:predicted nucleotidyltransferase